MNPERKIENQGNRGVSDIKGHCNPSAFSFLLPTFFIFFTSPPESEISLKFPDRPHCLSWPKRKLWKHSCFFPSSPLCGAACLNLPTLYARQLLEVRAHPFYCLCLVPPLTDALLHREVHRDKSMLPGILYPWRHCSRPSWRVLGQDEV